MANWLNEEIEFYDFIWEYGIGACGDCINAEMFKDFAEGGSKFEKMKEEIVKKFPTREAAMEAFNQSRKADVDIGVVMVDCFDCGSCKENGRTKPEPRVTKNAAFCNNPNISNDYPYAEYHRISTHIACEYFKER